jgi:hypothetical protein
MAIALIRAHDILQRLVAEALLTQRVEVPYRLDSRRLPCSLAAFNSDESVFG